jgi:precorrin-3B methylase
VTDAYRPAQRVVLGTLAGFDSHAVTMTTVVIVGSSHTRIVEGWMVTPRGYVLAGAP